MNIKFALANTFKELEKKLVEKSGITLKLSGSTCIIVFLYKNICYCANVGLYQGLLIILLKAIPEQF